MNDADGGRTQRIYSTASNAMRKNKFDGVEFTLCPPAVGIVLHNDSVSLCLNKTIGMEYNLYLTFTYLYPSLPISLPLVHSFAFYIKN